MPKDLTNSLKNPYDSLPDVFPLSQSVFFVQAPDKARFPFANGLVFTGAETVLLDAGLGAERIRAIDRIRRIDKLIISHPHPDHILSWHELADRHLLLPRETPDSAFDLDSLGRRFTGSAAHGAHWVDKMQEWIGLRPLREPDGRYGDGDLLAVGDARLRAIHAPGHLRDHYCFFEETAGILMATDIDLTGFGPWYGNPEADIRQFDDDIRAVAALPFSWLCTSHKPPLPGKDRAPLDDYRKILRRQGRQVLAQCRRPRTLEQIVDASPFYQNRFPDRYLQRIFETQLVAKNLDLLVDRGLAVVSQGTYRANLNQDTAEGADKV